MRFYGDFSRLSFHFFTSLMTLNTKYLDEYYRGLMPEAVGAETAVPTPPPELDDWTRWYQVLSSYTAEQNHRALEKYNKLLDKVSKGEIGSSALQEYSRKFSEDHAAALSQDAARLNAEFFEGLMRLNQHYTDELFERFSPNHHGPEEPMEPVYLELSGPLSSTVSGSLTVENTRLERAEITCAVSEFRNTDGTGPAFGAPVEVDPAAFSLRPDESQTVQVRLVLHPELFEADKSYAATMVIHGSGEDDLLVFLVAKPTAV
jgi:hypothetical protein